MEFVMESKGRKGQCLYNKKWEHDPQYKAWVSAYKADKRKALCHWCDRTIDVSSMGESALKSHSRSEKHKQNSRCQQRVTLSSFGFGSSASTSKCSSGNVEACVEESQQQPSGLNIPPPPDKIATPTSQQSMRSFLTKDDVLKAETLWTLKLVTNHYSFNSSADTANLFSAMFPDSEIAKQFACGERKAAYITVFGLAEHFKKLLKDGVKGPFVVLFDESLNKKMQEKQMDIHIRYWDNVNSEVTTRYFGSEFLGKCIHRKILCSNRGNITK